MNKFIKDVLRKNKYIEMLSYVLQNNQFFNSSGGGEFGDDVDGVYAHNVNVSKIYLENHIGNLEGKTVLEIGSGYTRATMLTMIKDCKLKKAYCYDRFNCIDAIDEKIIHKFGLSEYLDKLEYISGENQLMAGNIKSGSVDYIVSNAVLEHVDDLALLFDVLVEILAPSGQMYHKVDLRCHNRFKRHGELYFHTFSDKTWGLMGANIGQPNRKLLVDYHHIFENFRLELRENILENFSDDELLQAEMYLKKEDVSKYTASIVEFNLFKSSNQS